jgi:two-component system, chemotaxis family, CheB/CheR fusion protein
MADSSSGPSDNGTEATPSKQAPRCVVGIGASAGGLDPLVQFFDHLPKDTGMAFVIVQHLSPDFKSVMSELLARHTPLPIHLVEDGMPVEADHVYLIPAKKEMIISGGRLLLSERDRQQELTLPIDVFFRSLAQDCGPDAVAIVLSGAGGDGSRGIRDVHDAGGLVLVQDLESAQFDGMPRAAHETGSADHILAPAEMPHVLLEHAAAQSARPPATPSPTASSADGGLEAVYRTLQERFGIDFTHYKPSTVTRRIERRIALASSTNVEEYLRRIRDDEQELDALYHDLLIGVTRFFRDPKAFDLLERTVLPEILSRTPRETPLRFWVAGCATGEEAYSLAIVLQDLMNRLGERPVKIFATDVHRGSLARAAMATYEEGAVGNVSPDRLGRYFTRTGGMYQVVPEIRQLVVFAQHDVIRDAPFTRIDLVTCRNLLIYLQPAAQQRVLSFFHFSLTQGGVLMLGPSESLGPLAHGFEVLDQHWQLYRKHGEVRTPVEPRKALASPDLRVAPVLPPVPRHSLAQLLSVYDALLEDAMPPSLLLSEQGELVHVFGGAGRFLKVRDGRQGSSVLDVVDGELKTLLADALRRAPAHPGGLSFAGVRAGAEGETAIYRITVRPIRGRATATSYLVASFEAMEGDVQRPAPVEVRIEPGHLPDQQMALLEAELGQTRESLQAAIEQLEASNEELQASNEELQASNEELQSTNEELQSVNEELYTVNAEYQQKITQLTELTNDMDNLLAATEIGTIFLDSQLKIRKFTPHVAEAFALVPHDVGRSIETFAHKMDHPELVEDLRQVLATGQPVERDLPDVKGKSFFLRILPYRAKGTVDGVVLTMIDVSGLKAAEDALFHERYLLNSLLRSVPDAIYFKDARGRFIRANHAMAARLGLQDPASAAGKTAFDLRDRETATALSSQDDAVLLSGEAQLYRLERWQEPDGRERWDLVTRLPLVDGAGRTVGLIVIFRDVTSEKSAEAKIQEAVRRRDQFLAMLSHELRNPLGAIVTAASMLKTDTSDLPEAGRSLGVLERQSQQMARLLDDLLEASRVTQNKIELHKHFVDLRAVARDAADAVRGAMNAQGVEFTVDLPSEPVPIEGDPARLQQIHVNLLSNAAKYTPPGGHVRLSVDRSADAAVIRVRDDGSGIAPQMLDSVFDLFVQSTRTLDRAAGGLGLGLTLVRALVEMHGGSVTASSEGEGRGSEFVVRLPLAAAASIDAPDAAPRRATAGRAGRVVVVEDNPDSREMLRVLLARAGYECDTAATGIEALAVVGSVRPDIVILDLGLPELDGFEVARRLRADPALSGMRLVALTGYGQEADRAAALAAGFDTHLVKPAQGEQLLELLGQMSSDASVSRAPNAKATGPRDVPSPGDIGSAN